MGSERKESKRSKKSHSEHKSHKKHKKHHRSKHNHDESSPSDNEIDYNDPSLWTAEKTIEGIAPIADTAPSAATAIAPTAVATAPVQLEATGGTVRDSWMTDASLDFSSFGTAKQKEPKEEKPNPDVLQVSSREINPHFKAGLHIDQYPEQAKPTYKFGDAGSKWRMTKLKRAMEQAEDEGRPLEEVALEKYGSMEKFEEAMSERRALDGRHSRRDEGRSRDRGGSRYYNQPRMMFSDASAPARETFKKPHERQSRDSADVDEFGRSRRPKRSLSPSQADEEQRTKLAKAVSSTAAAIPARPVIITQHSMPNVFSEKPPLTTDELNRLNAKVVKARLMGADNVEELEQEYEKEKKRSDEHGSSKNPTITVVPTVDSQGRLHEFAISGTSASASSVPQRKHKEKFEGTHDSKTGERLKYGSNDDKLTLDDMVRQEKAGTRSATDMDMDLANRIAGDVTFEDDLDYMDEHAEKMATKKEKSDESKIRHAINDHTRSQKALDSCRWCYHDGNPPQCAMISLGTKTYLALPNVTDLVPGHCFIVPLQHAVSTLECDDDVWDEIRNFQKCLMRMFHDQGKGVIFMELVKNFKQQRHTVIECIPVPYGVVEDAPMYFQEAIKGSEGEWSQHKKLIDTSKRGFRRSMVKNLPYFHVWFSPNEGYGHVIEEEKEFPGWFGKEVVAGMMDLPPHLWRKPRFQHQSENRERQRAFLQNWSKYDWTAALEGGEFEQ